jgi:S-adenosylmethionine decarboxylase proenzyme
VDGAAALGQHVLADFLDVPQELLAPGYLTAAFRAALDAAGATVRRFVVEEFEPAGLSVMVVLGESHASLHTWPERRALLVDVFTCGPVSPLPVVEHLAARLPGARRAVVTVDRARP